MPRKNISSRVLMDRIETLRRRHSNIDRKITEAEKAQLETNVDIKQLKKERLGLKDAIRVTQTMLERVQNRSASFT